MAFLAGALIGTLFWSRMLYLLLRRWPGGYGKIVAVNVLTALFSIPWAAIGTADGGPPRLGDMAVIYGLCSLIVLIIDLIWGMVKGQAPLTSLSSQELSRPQ